MASLVRDYYKILGVDPEADDEIIKTVYRKLALKYHPDVAPSPSDAQRFVKIQEAYAVLSDPEKRRAYDASRAAKRKADRTPRARRRSRAPEGGSVGRAQSWDLRISLGGLDLLGLGIRVERDARSAARPPRRTPPARKPPRAHRTRPRALPPPKPREKK